MRPSMRDRIDFLNISLLQVIYLLPIVVIILWYARSHGRRERKSQETLRAAAEAGLDQPPSLHPEIDPTICIGCRSCVAACSDARGTISGAQRWFVSRSTRRRPGRRAARPRTLPHVREAPGVDGLVKSLNTWQYRRMPAVAYLRRSSDRNGGAESYEAQRAAVLELAKRDGDPEPELVVEWGRSGADAGSTGRGGRRRGLAAAAPAHPRR